MWGEYFTGNDQRCQGKLLKAGVHILSAGSQVTKCHDYNLRHPD